jgi:hypothetical protein
VSRGAALTGALLATLATPQTWPMALATFLLRGGLILVALPIVVLPSPVGLGNLLAPTIMTVVFGGVTVGVAVMFGLVALAVIAWIVVGGLVAAWLETEAAWRIARDDGVVGIERSDGADRAHGADLRFGPHRRVAWRIVAARIVVHVPTGLALIWGSARVGAVAYRELTSPFDVATPIVLRVLRGAPEVIAVIVVAWMLGEVLGGLASRRIALGGAGVPRALGDASVALVRHPLAVLLGFWVPTTGLVLVIAAAVVAATTAWDNVRVAIRAAADVGGATSAVVLFVALWIGSLALIAVTTAWRAAVWSVADREFRTRGPESAAGAAG